MKILIATDGSNFSQATIEACRKVIADPENTSFKIISAVENMMQIPPKPLLFPAELYNQIKQDAHDQSEKFVEQSAADLRALYPDIALDISTEVINGAAQRVIVERAENWKADLIIVGSHGYGFWSRALLGSVSSSVVQNARCSVLVVRKTPDESESV